MRYLAPIFVSRLLIRLVRALFVSTISPIYREFWFVYDQIEPSIILDILIDLPCIRLKNLTFQRLYFLSQCVVYGCLTSFHLCTNVLCQFFCEGLYVLFITSFYPPPQSLHRHLVHILLVLIMI